MTPDFADSFSIVGVKRTRKDRSESIKYARQEVNRFPGSPRGHLESIVTDLVKYKGMEEFPLLCAQMFDKDLFPVIEANTVRGSLVIPKMVATGKSLVVIIRIALATKIYGVEALNTMRVEFDKKRVASGRARSKHWFALKDTAMLKEIDTSTWGSVKRAVESRQVNDTEDTYSVHTLTDDDLFSLSDETVECFTAHELVPITAKVMFHSGDHSYNAGWLCDSCGFESERSDSPFDRCWVCQRDYCWPCSDRAVNFQ